LLIRTLFLNFKIERINFIKMTIRIERKSLWRSCGILFDLKWINESTILKSICKIETCSERIFFLTHYCFLIWPVQSFAFWTNVELVFRSFVCFCCLKFSLLNCTWNFINICFFENSNMPHIWYFLEEFKQIRFE